MINYMDCRGRLIHMVEPYPIYDREDDNKIIGYTEIGDMAVITYSNFNNNYHEVTIVSGKYTGVDTLALSNDDLYDSVFIMNNIDNHSIVCVNENKVISRCV